MSLQWRPPVTAMRTSLEPSRILERIVRIIPEPSILAPLSGGGLVGGTIHDGGFRLIWRLPKGPDYVVTGTIRDSGKDRLVRLRFDADSGPWFAQSAVAGALILCMAAFGLVGWLTALGALALSGVIVFAAAHSVPHRCITETTLRLTDILNADVL
jgi:hypothetical protein